MAWLGDLMEDDPNANPVGMAFENQALGGGTYTISVLDDLSGGGWFPAYEVVCAADVDGVSRSVRAVMVPETFAKYQWFVERGGWRWFLTGERFEGPVHVNKDLQIDGDPWFGGHVTAGGGITLKNGSNPTFEQGYELNVEEIALPDISDIDAVVKTAALNGGLLLGLAVAQEGLLPRASGLSLCRGTDVRGAASQGRRLSDHPRLADRRHSVSERGRVVR